MPILNENETDPLWGETQRRSFWSCWITSCISQDIDTFRSECWNDAVGLPLPCSEDSYSRGTPEVKESFEANGNLVPIGDKEKPDTAVLGELVKFYGLWYATFHEYLCSSTKSSQVGDTAISQDL